MAGFAPSDLPWNNWSLISAYTGALNDRIFNFLRDRTYTGSLFDMLYAYLGDEGYAGNIEKRMSDAVAAGLPAV